MTSLIMPAWQAGRYFGVKTVNIAPGNAALDCLARIRPTSSMTPFAGSPLALIDGNQITNRRTAAASAWPRSDWHERTRVVC